MTGGTCPPMYYGPFDAEIDRGVHAVWKRMREEQPVYWNERYGFWALSRFEDVWTGYHDTETFSSTHGVQPEALDKPAGLLEAEIDDGGGTRRLTDSAFASFVMLLAGAGVENGGAAAELGGRDARRHPRPETSTPPSSFRCRPAPCGFSSVPIHL
jgi:cytochrome P450